MNLDGIRRHLQELVVKPYSNKEEAKKAAVALERLHEYTFGIAGKHWVHFILEFTFDVYKRSRKMNGQS